jgi:hypothetical protein
MIHPKTVLGIALTAVAFAATAFVPIPWDDHNAHALAQANQAPQDVLSMYPPIVDD